MTRIAVLGTGRIGKMHAENICAHRRATLAGGYDIHAPPPGRSRKPLPWRSSNRSRQC